MTSSSLSRAPINIFSFIFVSFLTHAYFWTKKEYIRSEYLRLRSRNILILLRDSPRGFLLVRMCDSFNVTTLYTLILIYTDFVPHSGVFYTVPRYARATYVARCITYDF